MLNNWNWAGAEAKAEVLRRRRVIVRIWSSCICNGESFGHASIEYEFNGITYYVSFWPKNAKLHNVVVPCDSELVRHLHKDVELESRYPEYAFCFYTLDREEMLNEFSMFYRKLNTGNLNGWCLLGPIWEKFNCTSENCSSLVWRLLLAGGIRNLISPAEAASVITRETGNGSVRTGKEISRSDLREAGKESILATETAGFIVVTSPDGLKNVLMCAKAKELKQNPLTQEISFKGQTIPEAEAEKFEANWLYALALGIFIVAILCGSVLAFC